MGTVLTIIGIVSFIGYLIWLIVRIIQWDSKIPPIIGMLLSVIMVIGGVSTMQGFVPQESNTRKSQTESEQGSEEKPEDIASPVESKVGTFSIGETWEIDGQWSLTITGATETEYRNQFSEKNPEAVYMVEYTYENIGYTNELLDGLFFSLGDETIVDNAGLMGYSYPGDIVNYAKSTPVGAKCNAQACIGVDNAGDFKITVTKYDGNGDKQSATFNIAIS